MDSPLQSVKIDLIIFYHSKSFGCSHYYYYYLLLCCCLLWIFFLQYRVINWNFLAVQIPCCWRPWNYFKIIKNEIFWLIAHLLKTVHKYFLSFCNNLLYCFSTSFTRMLCWWEHWEIWTYPSSCLRMYLCSLVWLQIFFQAWIVLVYDILTSMMLWNKFWPKETTYSFLHK